MASSTDVEIVFVSSDSDESSFKEYYGSMPWVSLPFSASTFKDKLASQFGIRGIPALIGISFSFVELCANLTYELNFYM